MAEEGQRLHRVLVSDEVDDACLDMLRSSGIEVDAKTKLDQEQLIKEIPGYDGLIVRSRSKVTAAVVEASSALKIIGRAGTGVDNIDLDAAEKKGIVVINSPGGNTISAAEHTCAMILAVTRNVAEGTRCVRANEWNKKTLLIGNELSGKTLAVIGVGKIGIEVAKRMRAFGMKTIGYDPVIGATQGEALGIRMLSLEDIWPEADYITLHTPLTNETQHMINADVLSKCRKGVRVINCARGGIVEENALLESLRSGHVAGAGLDVFETEPPKCDALINHPRVTSTPHLGASTVEGQRRVAEDIAREFVAFSKGCTPQGIVTPVQRIG